MTENHFLPADFKERMQQQLGSEWSAFESAHTQPAPVSIRLNPGKTTTPIEGVPIPWCVTGRYLSERPVFTLNPSFHAGAFYVQEASSMSLEQIVTQHVPNREKIKVLDLCAAPGGKSTHLLSLIGRSGLLVSNEVIRSRVNILSENIQKWGHMNTVVTNNDPEDFSSLQGFFDVIVVDAPCSGEGLFRKDPSAAEEWSEDNVRLCAARQRRILDDIWPALKEGGLLVYSTCTYNEEEDEKTLRAFADSHDVEFLTTRFPEGVVESKVNQVIGYHFYPHKIRGEGFFISAMRKSEAQVATGMRSGRGSFAVPVNRIREEALLWLQGTEASLIQREDLIQALPSGWTDVIHQLSQRLRIVYAGTFLATVKNTKLVPHHSAALCIDLNADHFHSISLEKNEALQYLRRDALEIRSDAKGFALAKYDGIPIGWMNLLGNRMNNLYPQEWRIRMEIGN